MDTVYMLFQGMGKTYLASKYADIADIDVKDGNVIPRVKEALKKGKFPLVNTSYEVALELVNEDFEIYILAPRADDIITKERLFGRYILRKEQTSKNIAWIEKMKRNFDNYVALDWIKDIKNIHVIRINSLERVEDIICNAIHD